MPEISSETETRTGSQSARSSGAQSLPDIVSRSPRAGRKIVLLVALAVFAQEATWNFYDAQVPPLLRQYVSSAAVIGLVMGLDNLFGIFIQPWIGNRSDRTRSRFGRRMPYLMIGMPLAAVVFLLIPHAPNLPILIATIVGFALIANSFKPVAEALLPDYVTDERRSEANAVVKIAIGLTIVVSALVSLFVIDEHPQAAFAIPSALMLISVLVLSFMVRDNDSPGYRAALAADAERVEDHRPRVRDLVRDIVTDHDRSRLLLLVMIFLFAGSWAASRALITPFGQEVLGLTRGQAGSIALPGGIVFLLAAYPVALLARRIGRVRSITGGMILFVAAMVLATSVTSRPLVIAALCIGAIGYAGFAINGIVVLWKLAPSDEVVGTYTGLYSIAASLGAFAGPAVVGAMVDLTGWRFMLLDAGLVAAAAILVSVPLVRRERLERAVREGVDA